MWNTYTSTKVIKTQTNNIKNKLNESMDSLFEKVDSIFEDVEKVVESVDDDADIGNSSSYQSIGGTTITNNNGHIVIEGKVKSLKVNGVDVELEK